MRYLGLKVLFYEYVTLYHQLREAYFKWRVWRCEMRLEAIANLGK